MTKLLLDYGMSAPQAVTMGTIPILPILLTWHECYVHYDY